MLNYLRCTVVALMLAPGAAQAFGAGLAAIIHRGRIFALVRAARGAHDLHAQPEFSPQG